MTAVTVVHCGLSEKGKMGTLWAPVGAEKENLCETSFWVERKQPMQMFQIGDLTFYNWKKGRSWIGGNERWEVNKFYFEKYQIFTILVKEWDLTFFNALVKVEAVEGSSWLAHRGTGTRVALNVTANSQWKEVKHCDATMTRTTTMTMMTMAAMMVKDWPSLTSKGEGWEEIRVAAALLWPSTLKTLLRLLSILSQRRLIEYNKDIPTKICQHQIVLSLWSCNWLSFY